MSIVKDKHSETIHVKKKTSKKCDYTPYPISL